MSYIIAWFTVVIRQCAVKLPILVLAYITVDLFAVDGEIVPDGQLVDMMVLNRWWDKSTIIVDKEIAVRASKVETFYFMSAYSARIVFTGGQTQNGPGTPENETVAVLFVVKIEEAFEVEVELTSGTVVYVPFAARPLAFVAQTGGDGVGE